MSPKKRITMKDMEVGEVRLFYNADQVDDDLERALSLLFYNYGYEEIGAGKHKTTGVRLLVYRKRS